MCIAQVSRLQVRNLSKLEGSKDKQSVHDIHDGVKGDRLKSVCHVVTSKGLDLSSDTREDMVIRDAVCGDAVGSFQTIHKMDSETMVHINLLVLLVYVTYEISGDLMFTIDVLSASDSHGGKDTHEIPRFPL